MAQLRQRVQTIFQPAARLSQVASEVSKLETPQDGRPKATPVEVEDNHAASSVINWTSSILVRVGETLVLLYLLLASGDLFLQKIVRAMPISCPRQAPVQWISAARFQITTSRITCFRFP